MAYVLIWTCTAQALGAAALLLLGAACCSAFEPSYAVVALHALNVVCLRLAQCPQGGPPPADYAVPGDATNAPNVAEGAVGSDVAGPQAGSRGAGGPDAGGNSGMPPAPYASSMQPPPPLVRLVQHQVVHVCIHVCKTGRRDSCTYFGRSVGCGAIGPPLVLQGIEVL